jgi:hypothetical protein
MHFVSVDMFVTVCLMFCKDNYVRIVEVSYNGNSLHMACEECWHAHRISCLACYCNTTTNDVTINASQRYQIRLAGALSTLITTIGNPD